MTRSSRDSADKLSLLVYILMAVIATPAQAFANSSIPISPLALPALGVTIVVEALALRIVCGNMLRRLVGPGATLRNLSTRMRQFSVGV